MMPLDRPSRLCGECNVCCTLLSVDEGDFHKQAGEVCKHLKDGRCSIYNDPSKPKICADFYCLWAINPSGLFRDSDRPDKVGCLVNINDTASPFTQDTQIPTFSIHETKENGFIGYYPEKLLKRLQKKWLVVMLPWKVYNVTLDSTWIGPSKWISILKKYLEKK